VGASMGKAPGPSVWAPAGAPLVPQAVPAAVLGLPPSGRSSAAPWEAGLGARRSVQPATTAPQVAAKSSARPPAAVERRHCCRSRVMILRLLSHPDAARVEQDLRVMPLELVPRRPCAAGASEQRGVRRNELRFHGGGHDPGRRSLCMVSPRVAGIPSLQPLARHFRAADARRRPASPGLFTCCTLAPGCAEMRRDASHTGFGAPRRGILARNGASRQPLQAAREKVPLPYSNGTALALAPPSCALLLSRSNGVASAMQQERSVHLRRLIERV
jgi:hypothetical protein